MTQQGLIEKIVKATGDLPSMPQVASLVMEKMADPSTTVRQLHEIISRDQALAARVLRIGNSPLYGYTRHVSSITDAIVIMGFNNIKSLVMASALHDFFKSFGFAEKLLWEHSIGCASVSRIIAKKVRLADTETAFLAGLLHDIGKVVLNLKLPEKTLEILQEVYNNPGITFSEVEREIYGFTHSEVGSMVARKWNFAAEVEETIGKHHQPQTAKISPALTVVTSLANSFCHKLGIGPTRNPDLDIASLAVARALKLDQVAIDDLLASAEELIKSDQTTFSPQ